MKHMYDRKDTRDLLYVYETLLKNGAEVNLREIDYLKLISYLESEKLLSDALEVSDFGLSKFKFSRRLHTSKAKLLIADGQEELAFESIDRAEVFGQSFVIADLLRAEAYLSLDQIKNAYQLIFDLKYNYHTTDIERSDILYIEAKLHEHNNEYDLAYECLEEASFINPFNDVVLQKLYSVVEIAKKHESSIKLHHYILDENPYSHTAWFNLAQAYYYLGEYESALDAFEYAFITNERFEPAYKEYAEVCFHLKMYDKALDAINEALDFFDADSELLLKAGQCYQYLGNTEQAKIYFYRALSLDKYADEVYYHIGSCYSLEEKHSTSIHFYKQAIKHNEFREDYLMALAKSYSNMGRYQAALPLFRKASEMGPELSENWTAYANFLIKINGLDEALEVIMEGELNSYGADLYYCKAALLFKLDNRSEALDALGEALTADLQDHNKIYEYLPDHKSDRDIQSIIRYYKSEA